MFQLCPCSPRLWLPKGVAACLFDLARPSRQKEDSSKNKLSVESWQADTSVPGTQLSQFSSHDESSRSWSGNACETPYPASSGFELARQDSANEFLAGVDKLAHPSLQDSARDLGTFYTLHGKQLGNGAYGKVYRGTCRLSGIQRAVKSVNVSTIRHLEALDREVSVAKSLHHPNVVRLHETFHDANHLHLVFELCSGSELYYKIKESDGFSEALSATYVRQILQAVCYLHANCVVHRDVKPENFLLQSPHPSATLKMIDFGLARRFEPGQQLSTKVGTAHYVAPQVLMGEYDAKCDVWSAGVVLYIMLSGYLPFHGECDRSIFKQIRKGAVEFPSPEWDSVSAQARELVAQMLSTEVSCRPSAGEALASPWLQASAKSGVVPAGFVASLERFRNLSTLQKLARLALAQQLPDEETEIPRRLFQYLDQCGEGMLTTEEIRDGLRQHGMQVPDELADIVQSVCTDGSGRLDYSVFVAATMDESLCERPNLCLSAFRALDLDGKGWVATVDLERVLAVLGLGQEADRVLLERGVARDECINFEEFCNLLLPTR